MALDPIKSQVYFRLVVNIILPIPTTLLGIRDIVHDLHPQILREVIARMLLVGRKIVRFYTWASTELVVMRTNQKSAYLDSEYVFVGNIPRVKYSYKNYTFYRPIIVSYHGNATVRYNQLNTPAIDIGENKIVRILISIRYYQMTGCPTKNAIYNICILYQYQMKRCPSGNVIYDVYISKIGYRLLQYVHIFLQRASD